MHRPFDRPPPPAARAERGGVAYGRMSQSVWMTTASEPQEQQTSRFLTDRGYRRGRLAVLVGRVAQRADQSP
jgi:hypothetical protein